MPKLTTRRVETAPVGYHHDGAGLYLVVGASGSRSWIFRYQFRGRRRDMGLGSARYVTLREARDLAYQAHRTLVLEKVDPLEKRRGERPEPEAPKSIITFEHVAHEYIKTKRSGWAPRYISGVEQSLHDYVYPFVGKQPVEKFNFKNVQQILEPLWLTKPKLAQDIRSRLGAIIEYAKGSEWYEGDNPARSTYLTTVMPAKVKTKSHESLPWSKIATFIAELRVQDDIPYRLIEFIILNGSRLDEARSAPWSEFNLEEGLWTIPADRHKTGKKTGKEHKVPLSTAAMVVLRRMQAIRQNDYVFPGVSSPVVADSTIRKKLKAMRPDITIHGFRATFSDWATEHTEFPRDMVEIALAHKVGNDVEQAYKRGSMIEKRRVLMETWAAYCAGVEPSDVVVPLRSAG